MIKKSYVDFNPKGYISLEDYHIGAAHIMATPPVSGIRAMHL
jgi:hypothetical protein